MSTSVAEDERGSARVFSFRDVVFVAYIFLLCQPYIRWLGVGTASDVQIYPVLLALPFLASQMFWNSQRIGAQKSRDPLLLALMLAGVPIAALQLTTFEGSAFANFRGLYGYFSIGILTWTWVWVFRAVGRKLSVAALKISFWSWLVVGAVQLVWSDFAVFGRTKLIITPGRGALSFATEPAYFAFALLLISLALWLLTGSSRYVAFATVATALVARSSIGIMYCFVAALVLFDGSTKRKASLFAVVVSVWWAAVALLQGSRISFSTKALFEGPIALIASDKSVGLRYINVLYPVQGFVENLGAPHGLLAWPTYQWQRFISSSADYSWAVTYDPNATGRILSIHGLLLFELGVYSFVYYLIFWKILRRSEHAVALGIIGLTIFMNGVTLNSPFLALVLAAAYEQPTVTRGASGEGRLQIRRGRLAGYGRQGGNAISGDAIRSADSERRDPAFDPDRRGVDRLTPVASHQRSALVDGVRD